MKKEKILITDLDGTFVKNSICVSKKDKDLMHNFKKVMKVGIATGRSIKEIHFIEEQIGLKMDVTIGFNGAIIEVNGHRIFEEKISKCSLVKVLKYIQQERLFFDALDGIQRIGTYRSDEKGTLWNMELVEPENVFSLLLEKDIYKINVRPKTNMCDTVLKELIEKFPELSICKSGKQRIEITAAGITKGRAIEILKEKYNLIVISVGDSENDISMFNKSDHSFCLSHASNIVKEGAETIINDFHDIRNFISIN